MLFLRLLGPDHVASKIPASQVFGKGSVTYGVLEPLSHSSPIPKVIISAYLILDLKEAVAQQEPKGPKNH